MKYIIYIHNKHPIKLYKNAYSANTKIGAWIKALWATKFNWKYYRYLLEE